MAISDRLKNAWNAFSRPENERIYSPEYGSAVGFRPDRQRLLVSNEKSLVTSLYTRLAIDCAELDIRHVRLDDQERFKEELPSALNNCLSLEANIDQAAQAFKQDIFMTMCDKGVAAIVPVDTTTNLRLTNSFDILTMRVGEVIQWYPRHVRVKVYNDRVGERQELTLPKEVVAIVENPMFSVMNEPNSTLQRLIRKLNILDAVDEQTGSGKLDLIIQLPYVIKTDTRRAQAESRRKDIESQLQDSKYGIAYTDGTERITQLNRPAENNLMAQIETLTNMLYSQLGLTPEVFNGTANEAAMLNYHNRTIAPFVTAVTQAMKRTFLTKTARTQGQSVEYFRDPFKLVPVSQIAEIADKFTRNEVLTSNEVRSIIGRKPVDDAKADELRNKNLPEEPFALEPPAEQEQLEPPKEE